MNAAYFKNRIGVFCIRISLLVAVIFHASFFSSAAAQEAPPAKIFTAKMRAADPVTLVAGTTSVRLWGVENIESASPAFKLKARTVLDNAMSSVKVECEVRGQRDQTVLAQCVNGNDLDLGLFMLQQGYVTADRSVVYGTVFEGPYIQAEQQAQSRGLGIWSETASSSGTLNRGGDGAMMISFGFILFIFIIAAFAVLSIVIMRGFKKVIDAQNDNVEMMTRERKLRDKERGIVAVMLDSELKANKAKIEAYLVVYEEMLKGLKDPDRPPKYKKSGDILQKQPALDRSVFDRNTDKLDILGQRLSSQLIHFYARIKSNPEYINIEPGLDQREVIRHVEESVKNAQRLNQIAEKLIDAFAGSGITSARPFAEDADIDSV